MGKNWDDLQYGHLTEQDNKLIVDSAGARYDQTSGTIIWNYGDVFKLKFKPEELTDHELKQNSIYDEVDIDISDQFEGYKFQFSVFSIYGSKEAFVYDVNEIEMEIDGTIPVMIDYETSKTIRAGIYSYQLIAYKDSLDGVRLDAKTIIGRKQGKIHVLS